MPVRSRSPAPHKAPVQAGAFLFLGCGTVAANRRSCPYRALMNSVEGRRGDTGGRSMRRGSKLALETRFRSNTRRLIRVHQTSRDARRSVTSNRCRHFVTGLHRVLAWQRINLRTSVLGWHRHYASAVRENSVLGTPDGTQVMEVRTPRPTQLLRAKSGWDRSADIEETTTQPGRASGHTSNLPTPRDWRGTADSGRFRQNRRIICRSSAGGWPLSTTSHPTRPGCAPKNT